MRQRVVKTLAEAEQLFSVAAPQGEIGDMIFSQRKSPYGPLKSFCSKFFTEF
jgi:hypothetical protein